MQCYLHLLCVFIFRHLKRHAASACQKFFLSSNIFSLYLLLNLNYAAISYGEQLILLDRKDWNDLLACKDLDIY